ncbi:MAG: NPCBM/NEW2 domain-containing protein [Phycisphaerae bacterium]|nr:NPCBM/NEW2 domain-containing protein [Phycisphaerae bacterium]
MTTCALVMVGFVLAGVDRPAPPDSPRFRLVLVDGATRDVASVALGADESLRTSPASDAALTVDDVIEIAPLGGIGGAEAPAFREGPVRTVFLRDGGMLRGRIESDDVVAEGLRLRTGWDDVLRVPKEHLAAIRLAAERPAMERELSARRATRDVSRDLLIVEGGQRATVVPGALERLTPTRWAFRVGDRVREGDVDRVYAIVWARLAGDESAATARMRLRDGQEFGGTIRAMDADGVVVEPSFGGSATLPWAWVDRVLLRSSRVEFLSDRTPEAVESRGVFGDRWPWRADAGWSGGPLRIGTRRLGKGLAVHAYSRMEYALGPGDSSFAATIGLEGGPGEVGSVVFRVRSESRVLFDSGTVRGNDAARDIVVPLKGAKRLILEVDMGDDLDHGDRAVWGSARLIR